ncbi:MAG: hypothetical protein J2P13_12035 [Acidobacteria bacterium]|nr:hypothetical protein [Acidobacteriota bacterium]
MNKPAKCLTLLAVLATAFFLSGMARTAPVTRYLHVRVTNRARHELVRVNVPLALAEKVIPAIKDGRLRDGKISIGDRSLDHIDIHAILDALKTAPEGEFVTVEDAADKVRVAKERGELVVHVEDRNGSGNVEVTIPWNVAEALVSGTDQDQLNVEAGIKALENSSDTTLVRVSDREEQVRVWIDSRTTDSE